MRILISLASMPMASPPSASYPRYICLTSDVECVVSGLISHPIPQSHEEVSISSTLARARCVTSLDTSDPEKKMLRRVAQAMG